MRAVDLATAESRLASVQRAIAAAEAAQSYSGNGRSKTMANLETLYRKETELEAVIARMKDGSGGMSRGVVVGLEGCG